MAKGDKEGKLMDEDAARGGRSLIIGAVALVGTFAAYAFIPNPEVAGVLLGFAIGVPIGARIKGGQDWF